MIYKPLARCKTVLLIRKIQIKSTIIHNFIHIQLIETESLTMQSFGMDLDLWNLLHTSGGL